MQTISVIHQLNKGDKVHAKNNNDNHILRNMKSEKNTLFMGWLLKASEPRIVFDGVLDSNHHTAGTIPCSSTYQNLGNGLKIVDGSFTAPVSGIYYFHFQGLTDTGDSNFISIKLNGRIVASTLRNNRTVKRLEELAIIH